MGCNHRATILSPYEIEVAGNTKTVEVTRTKRTLFTSFTNEIIRFLSETQFTNCPRCGGIIPELWIILEDKEFRFTLNNITINDKNVLQTDFEKFGEYCKTR